MADARPVTGVQLLGPVRAHAGGVALPLGGGKPRGVFATLALRRPHAVQLPDLARGLWGDDAPPSAVATLQAYLSRLRSTLGADAVVGGRSGYRLVVDPQVVDVDRFRELLRRGRAAAGRDDRGAAELVEAALAQWQGAALADLLDLPGAAAAAAGLEVERLSARKLLFSLRLGLGQHAVTLPQLQETFAEHPLDEEVARQLMLALYASGRQAAALDVYTRLRARLVEELGVEPAPETRSLHTAVLGQDEALRVTPEVRGPGNLPAFATPLVGRRRELTEIAALVHHERRVDLAGPGGIGKSRLALAVALAARPADGAWLVDLSAVVRPDLVLTAVTAALAVRDQPGVAPYDALVAALRARDVLLVMDGCDHVLDACSALLIRLQADCPALRAVTTSTRSLPAATAYHVEPLGEKDAVELLLVRANEGSASPVVHDRHQLAPVVDAAGGVPLDLELVAARLRTTSAQELVASLEERTGAVLTWTLDALDADERRLVSRLAVFPGAFSVSAATVVAAGDVDGLLPALVRRSLVTVEPGDDADRYRLPDTVRATMAPTPAEPVAARHASACVELVERAGARLRGPASLTWLDRLDLEQASIRAALHWTVAHRPADALRLVGALGWYWFRRGRIREGRAFVEAALTAAADGEQVVGSGELLADARLAGAALAYHAGDLAALETHTSRGLADAGARGSVPVVVRLLLLRSWQAALTAGVEPARPFAEQAHAAATGHAELESETLLTLGMLQRHVGDPVRAAETLEQSRAAGSAAGHSWAVGSAAWIAAKVALDRGQPGQAHALYAESLRGAVADDDVASGLVNLHGIAGVLAITGNAERGAQLLGAVAAIGERIGYDPVRMDPVDGPRNVQAVHDALSGRAFGAAFARGRELSFAAATALGYTGLSPAKGLSFAD